MSKGSAIIQQFLSFVDFKQLHLLMRLVRKKGREMEENELDDPNKWSGNLNFKINASSESSDLFDPCS